MSAVSTRLALVQKWHSLSANRHNGTLSQATNLPTAAPSYFALCSICATFCPKSSTEHWQFPQSTHSDTRQNPSTQALPGARQTNVADDE